MKLKRLLFVFIPITFIFFIMRQIGSDEEDIERPISTPTGVVECKLSRHAEKIDLINVTSKMCRRHCRAASKPLFCDRKKFLEVHGTPRFDFSRTPSDEGQEVMDRVDVVYSALGDYFYSDGGQSYVFDCIRQWRVFHSPKISRVFLVVDDQRASDLQVTTLSKELSITLVRRSDIGSERLARYHRVFYIHGYMHPGGNRSTGNKQFNQLVTERFFAVASVMRQYNLRHVIHMENDNLIFTDMRRIVQAITRCGYEIAATAPFVLGFIPGVVYIKDAASIERFCDFVNDFLSCGKKFGVALERKVTGKVDPYGNDMSYLMRYYQLFGTNRMGELPSRMHAKGENCILESSKQLGLSPYLFDAVSFGQWYSFSKLHKTGLPPLCVRNMVKRRFMDITPPPHIVYVKEDGINVPTWKGLRLISLHIHAKNLREFWSL